MINKIFGLNIILQVGVKFLAIGLGFITTRILIDQLSEADYTTYNLIISYNAVLLMGLLMGIPNIILKFYTNNSDESKRADFWTTFGIIRVFSFLVGLVIVLFTYQLSQRTELWLTLGLFTAQFILIADLNYRSVCDALGRSWQFSITDFVGKLLVVIGLISGTRLFYGTQFFTFFVIVLILSYLIALLIDAVWQFPHTGFGKFRWSIVQEFSSSIGYLTVSLVATAIYFNTDRLFLAYFGYNDGVVSGYANAYKFFEIASVLPGLTMPAFASLTKRKLDKLELNKYSKLFFETIGITKIPVQIQIYLECLGIAFGVGLISLVGLIVVGPFTLQLVDVEMKYPLALMVIPYLAIAHLPQTIGLLTGNLVVLTNGERYEMFTAFIVAIFGITAYVILIPQFSLVGAAVATIAIYSIDFLLKLASLYHNYFRKISN